MKKVGSIITDFTLLNQSGQSTFLSDFDGKKKVIYFYPRDNTPGCTRQASSFASLHDEFVKDDIIVMGISKDSVASHRAFATKNNLPFLLLSDPNLDVINQFGVYQAKTIFGKKTMGVVRSTFILDEENKVIKVFPRAKPDGNAEEVIAFLRQS